MAELGPGDLFGELALLTRSPRDATVTAITPMVLVVFEERAFRGLMIEVPTLGRALIARLGRGPRRPRRRVRFQLPFTP